MFSNCLRGSLQLKNSWGGCGFWIAAMPNDEFGIFEPVTNFSATFTTTLVFTNPIYLLVLATIE